MANRHPRNAVGDFFVEEGACVACMLPHEVAPDLMGFTSTPPSSGHCFFARQPASGAEVAEAVEAVVVSCCQALRYAGTDPATLEALASRGAGHQCDALRQESSR
jgi:hypothetical protein